MGDISSRDHTGLSGVKLDYPFRFPIQPEARQAFSAEEEVLERNIETKETINKHKPDEIMNVKPSVIIQLVAVHLEEDDSTAFSTLSVGPSFAVAVASSLAVAAAAPAVAVARALARFSRRFCCAGPFLAPRAFCWWVC